MKMTLPMGLCALMLGACASAPPPLPAVATLLGASDPAQTTPLPRLDPFDGYTHRSPTGPRDWRAVNDEQSEAR